MILKYRKFYFLSYTKVRPQNSWTKFMALRHYC